jgi:hypothetical protein
MARLRASRRILASQGHKCEASGVEAPASGWELSAPVGTTSATTGSRMTGQLEKGRSVREIAERSCAWSAMGCCGRRVAAPRWLLAIGGSALHQLRERIPAAEIGTQLLAVVSDAPLLCAAKWAQRSPEGGPHGWPAAPYRHKRGLEVVVSLPLKTHGRSGVEFSALHAGFRLRGKRVKRNRTRTTVRGSAIFVCTACCTFCAFSGSWRT